MDRIVDQFIKWVDLVHDDGSRVPADLNIEERITNGDMLFTITLQHAGRTVAGRSKWAFFDALQNLRIELEKDNILLHCFGASEDVYPSSMQIDFGGTKAYRMRLGAPTDCEDVVDIFASDDSVKPVTVDQQEQFRERWIESLPAGRIGG
jgi:hypothetical protein